MSLIDKLKSLVSPGTQALQGSRLYIVDTTDLLPGKGKASPRDQLNLMDRLTRFAEKEKINVFAVFEGKPLRKVGHGEVFKESITVYYSEKTGSVSATAIKLLKSHTRKYDTVLVTSDEKLEQTAEGKGSDILRTSTFSKALEGGGGGSGRQRRPRNKPSSGRSRRRPSSKDKQNKGGGSESNPKKDGVSDLIDLVE